MDSKLILAVAGAGKTYKLCHDLDPNERNLLIAYTHQNLDNIRKELKKRLGKIPKNTHISTFHSFIYQFFILPFESLIFNHFNVSRYKTDGITFIDPPKPNIPKNGSYIYNYRYIKKDKIEHYLHSKRYYCTRMSKLIMELKDTILERGILRLELFFDNIYIDEFQDFREYDYEILMHLVKAKIPCYLYGDYYQHSVSGINNSGKPFKKGKNNLSYNEFIEEIKNNGITVDTESLSKSRRCPEEICQFIKEKLDIDIGCNNENNGQVIFLHDEEDIEEVISNEKIVKLVYRDADKYNFPAINWSYSKGDTYDSVCVILTGNLSKIDNENFIPPKSITTFNKLYVALSRTKGDLYLLHKKNFDNYIKNNDTI